jgi:hypothetical protein
VGRFTTSVTGADHDHVKFFVIVVHSV